MLDQLSFVEQSIFGKAHYQLRKRKRVATHLNWKKKGTSSPSPSLLSNLNNKYRFTVFQPPISNEGITL